MTEPLERACTKCRSLKALTEFATRIKDSNGGKKGEPSNKCKACMEREKEYVREARKRKRAENEDPEDEEAEEAWRMDPDSSVMAWQDFMDDVLGGIEHGQFKLAACVEPGPLTLIPEEENIGAQARAIAAQFGKETLWRWK